MKQRPCSENCNITTKDISRSSKEFTMRTDKQLIKEVCLLTTESNPKLKGLNESV